MAASTYLIVFGIIALLYPILHALVLRWTEPVRLEFADIGKSLLSSPDISEEHKELISDMLDDVFSWRFMAFATFAFPVAVFRGGAKTRLDENEKQLFDRPDMSRFVHLHMKSVMAASPLWAAAFAVVAAFTLVLAIVWTGFSFFSYVWADTVKQVTPNIHSHRADFHPAQ